MNKIARIFQVRNYADKSFPFEAGFSNNTRVYSELHSHSRELEIHYITAGRGTYLINNRLYEFKAGTLLIIHRNEIHRLVEIKSSISQYVLYFAPGIFGDYGDLKTFALKHLFKSTPIVSEFQGAGVELELIFRSLFTDYKTKSPYWKEAVISGLVRLCVLLQGRPAGENKKYNVSGKDKDIEDALTFIDKNYSKELPLELIAGTIGLTPNYLSSKFTKTVGMTLKDYIIAKRINEAKKRLETAPGDKIISIAYESGYKDLSNFNHTFKKLTGYTPSAYRKLIKS